MIVIVDYNVGNIGSIVNMFKKIGVEATLSSCPEEISKASKLLLPGVGAFDNGMKSLKKSNLIPILEKKVLVDKTPILGICLGMQLLFESSEEGSEEGLGWIAGKVRKFDLQSAPELKVPHMGWNQVIPENHEDLFLEMTDISRFYFVHSYYVDCTLKENVLATTRYGDNFVSSVRKENIYGAQFHPEKSHKFGMKLLKNFKEHC